MFFFGRSRSKVSRQSRFVQSKGCTCMLHVPHTTTTTPKKCQCFCVLAHKSGDTGTQNFPNKKQRINSKCVFLKILNTTTKKYLIKRQNSVKYKGFPMKSLFIQSLFYDFLPNNPKNKFCFLDTKLQIWSPRDRKRQYLDISSYLKYLKRFLSENPTKKKSNFLF